MHPLAPIAFAALALIQSAQTELPKLTGFRDFKFGMTAADANKIQPFETHPPTAISELYLTSRDRIDAFGLSYSLGLSFTDDTLRRIVLISTSHSPEDFCSSHFEDTLSGLEGDFGSKAERRLIRGLSQAAIRMRNNAYIKVRAIWTNEPSPLCFLTVEYFAEQAQRLEP